MVQLIVKIRKNNLGDTPIVYFLLNASLRRAVFQIIGLKKCMATAHRIGDNRGTGNNLMSNHDSRPSTLTEPGPSPW